MDTRIFTKTDPTDDWTVVQTKVQPPPPPQPLPHEVKQDLPSMVIPPVVVNIQQPPPDNVIQAKVEPPGEVIKTAPPIGGGGGGAGEGVKQTVAPPPAMRSAVLADAKNCVTPDYPARSARNGDTGTVVLALLVGTNGSVINSRIVTSSGFRELDRAAQSALSMCAFKPAMENGVAQEGWAQIAYAWRLD